MEQNLGRPKPQLTTFLEEWRVISICLVVALAHFQYGYDAAAVSGFQAMPGFLQVYGYPEVNLSLLNAVALLAQCSSVTRRKDGQIDHRR